jgi:predicted RNA-binding Zn ribbon-like protein
MMETSTQVRELPVVAGHLALDFANTVDDPEGRPRHDHVATYPDLLSWCVRVGTLSPVQAGRLQDAATSRPRAAAAALRKAHALRAAVQAVFTDVADGGSASTAWADLHPFVVDAVSHAEIVAGASGYVLAWPDTEALHAMLWPVAHAAADLLTGADVLRVKRCGGCPWLFVDRSKNGSRRWCTMDDCGTHAKIRRYVARRAALRAHERVPRNE